MTPADVQVVVGVRFVGEVCEEYEKKGSCVNGNACRKAHGGQREVQMWSAWFESRPSRNMPRDANGNYKRTLCRTFSEKGVCPYFAKCMFAHGEIELQSWRAWREACPSRPAAPTSTRWTLDSAPSDTSSEGSSVSSSNDDEDHGEWMREIDASMCDDDEDPHEEAGKIPEALQIVLDIVTSELRDVAASYASVWPTS
jgi:hypothetical protein